MHDKEDIEIKLQEKSHGVYEGITESHIKGQREVKLAITKNNDQFFSRKRWIFSVP